MTDIVERLRNLARNYSDGVAGMVPQDHFAWEAADEIERLRQSEKHWQKVAADGHAEIERLCADVSHRDDIIAKRDARCTWLEYEIERLQADLADWKLIARTKI